MSDRILCPVHEEKTPSCKLYDDGKYFCFGCRAQGFIKDLGIYVNEVVIPKTKENLEESLARIDDLDTKLIRGLELPYDKYFFYLVYPNTKFYKKRKLDSTEQFKYISPRGHPQPLYKVGNEHSPTLCIVEGELNALSLSKAVTGPFIVSPGACVNFNLRFMKQLAVQLPSYRDILIVVDYDPPGVSAAMGLKAEILPINPRVRIKAMKADCNDILVNYGTEALKEEFKDLEMPS